MRISPDEGCQDVPDPIEPIDMMLVSLVPTLTPMSLPDVVNSEPTSVACVSIAGVPVALGGDGDGEAAGIGMPGMADGIAAGVADGVGDGWGFWAGGIFMPGIS